MIFFSIWVDADSCPLVVREMVIRFSNRLKIPVFFVANRTIPHPTHSLVTMIQCSTESDAADDYIVNHIKDNDIAITRDILFAERLVEKNVVVLNDRGEVFSAENIGERLALRNLNFELFERGLKAETTNQYNKKHLNTFANTLDREIQKKLRLSKKL